MKTDPKSVLFSEENIDKRLLKMLKKSRYKKDSLLLKLILSADNTDQQDNDKIPARADFVGKRDIDTSTLYCFDGPFQLIHADVGNVEFLGKNATIPRYVQVVVSLYSSKVYIYPMRSRKQISQKMRLFYDEVRSKRKNKRMKLQVDIEVDNFSRLK